MKQPPYFDTENNQIQNGGSVDKINYDSPDFYAAVENLAVNGATNEEIAVGLNKVIGTSLTPSRFNQMVRGDYECWTGEQNATRGARLRAVLESARLDTNRIVKATYLKTALGRNVTKTVTTVKRRMRIDGQYTDNEEVQTTEVISGIAPNMQALATWLYHHDAEWRKVTKGQDFETSPDAPPTGTHVKKGIDITSWIDQEMTNKEANSAEEDSDEEQIPQ